MILIMLSENFHSTFAADDIDQSTDGIIKTLPSLTQDPPFRFLSSLI